MNTMMTKLRRPHSFVVIQFGMAILSLALLLATTTDARTWNGDIVLFHDLSPIDGEQATRDPIRLRPGDPYESNPFEFLDTPTTSSNVFASPTTPAASPTTTSRPPSATFISPTQVPTGPTYPEDSVVPLRPPRGYFNYDSSEDGTALYGPGHPVMEYTTDGFLVTYADNMWGGNWEPPYQNYDWDEFGYPGWGPWANTLTDHGLRTTNLCDVGTNQSPIDVRLSGVACVETHQIRILPGDFRVTGSSIEKQILPSKLRLKYQRRPCSDILNNPVCSEPDPPQCDFPNGWGGFSDMLHVDFKFPSEHRIKGEMFDGEMQIYHLHPGRQRLPVISVMMRAVDDDYTVTSDGTTTTTSSSHNTYLQAAIDAFQYEYDTNMARCAGSITTRNGNNGGTIRHRKLGNSPRDIPRNEPEASTSSATTSLSETIKATFGSYEVYQHYSRLLEPTEDGQPSDFIKQRNEHYRRMTDTDDGSGVWYPHHESLISTYYFYGYDGSLTEPPCAEIVSWFIMDTPMTLSRNQLEQMKQILFTNVNGDTCESTSVHYQNSVARPIQETGGRQVWQCTRNNFIPDNERTS